MITFGVRSRISGKHEVVAESSHAHGEAVVAIFSEYKAAEEYSEFMGFLSVQFEETRQR